MTTSTASSSTPRRSSISITPRVACLQIKHGTIWSFFKTATPSSTSPMKSRWPPPPSIAMVHRLPLMLSPLLVSPTLLQHLDLLVWTGLDPHIASVAVLNATSSESLLATPLPTVADPVPGNLTFGNWTSPASPLRLTVHRRRGDPPPGGHRHLGGPLRLLRGESPHGGPLRLLRGPSHHRELHRLPRGELPPRGHLRLSVLQAIQAKVLPLPRDPFLGVLSLKDVSPGNPSLQREVPLLQKDDVMRRETQSPLHLSTHLELLHESPRRRDPTHGLLLVQLPLPERRKKLTKLPFQPRLRPWWNLSRLIFLMPSPPRPRSPLDLSASVGVTDPATPSGSLLGWSQVMSDAFLDTQKKFSQRIQEGRTCHTLLPSLHRLEKVSNSPTQGKELTANPDVLDLLKNKVQDFRQLPISIKEGVALERTLRSMMESHSFLTWSVMGLLKSLHLKSLLPKDDPVITQLQKSFSKACSSFASSMTTSAAFVTMKRRQLLLSHVVPSISEAQKRNLLSDPFFQTSSLFDASSVESARSAARDMSLFKPHLKASTSSSQARRQGPSSSSGRRGSARQYSGPSSSQRASSPFRQQSGKKGDARFHKKSSGTPQKRGGFRK